MSENENERLGVELELAGLPMDKLIERLSGIYPMGNGVREFATSPISREAAHRLSELSVLLATRTAERDALRQRAYLADSTTPGTHSTACLTWGDDGQGHVAEGWETRRTSGLHCNCGAWAAWETQRANKAEAERDALQVKAEYNAPTCCAIYSPSSTPPPKGTADAAI